VERAEQIRHRIETREHDKVEKLSAKIKQELAQETAQGEAAVRERITALEAVNTALQESMNERIAAAEQQTSAALSQYEALAADQEQILASGFRTKSNRSNEKSRMP
jgi:hypothetical protein